MKTLCQLVATALVAFAPLGAFAQSNPVVVELFTSQGCSSCPPADDYLTTLIGQEDVLPLAFHVDYWDRLGWKDTLGAPEFTARQYAYGKAFSNRSVWTPQFVVGGTTYSRGSFRDLIPSTVKKMRGEADQVRVTADKRGNEVLISVEPLANNLPEMLISLVGYSNKDVVDIKRGENAGRTITYVNTVRSWVDVARWDGSSTVSYSAPTPEQTGAAVIVQVKGNGPIMAAGVVN